MMFARVRTSLGLAVILMMAGCGPAGPEKVEVEGTMSFDGVPVDFGAIELIPAVSGPKQPIMVRKGKFQAKGEYAVLCGEYTLVFHAWEMMMPGDHVMDEMVGGDDDLIPEMMERVEMLPKQYSTEECKEKLSLKPGTGSVTLTYDLKS